MQMLLGAVLAAITLAPAFATDSHTFDVVSVDVQPWCNNSFRVRMRPANASGAPAASEPAALYTCDGGGGSPKAKCAGRNDTGLCISPACVQNEAASGYVRGTVVGYTPGPAAAPAQTTPLALYWNAALKDNLVGPDDASFVRVLRPWISIRTDVDVHVHGRPHRALRRVLPHVAWKRR